MRCPAPRAQMQPLLGPETDDRHRHQRHALVVFLQARRPAIEDRRVASVDPDGELWDDCCRPQRAIGCIVYPAAEVPEPGVIEHTYGDRFTLGEPDGSRSAARQGAVGGADRGRLQGAGAADASATRSG